MNRSLFSMAALSALYTTAAATSGFILNDTRRAGDPLLNYSLCIGNDASDAGGTEVKTDTVMAKGELVGDSGSTGSEQQQAAAGNNPTQAGTLDAKPAEDLAAGIDAGSTTVVKDPPADQLS